jgi:hypothetical protein
MVNILPVLFAISDQPRFVSCASSSIGRKILAGEALSKLGCPNLPSCSI